MQRNDDYILISLKRKHMVVPYHPKTKEIGDKVYAALIAHGYNCMWGSEFVNCLKVSYEASLKADGLPVD
jgi:hypothetical protein